MPHYKDSNNKLHFLDSSEHEYLLPAGCVKISDTEAYKIQFPPMTLSQAYDEQIVTLTAAYNAAIQSPIAYMATTFQADEASQSVLTKVLVAGAVPTEFAWLDANNMPVNMTYAQLQGLAVAMLAQGQAAFVKLQTLKSQVRAATTVTKAQAVVW